MKSTWAPLVILALFLSLGLSYGHYTPLWNPPDEERHFAYCEYIAQHHALPPYRPDPEGNIVSMAFHPPLYYLMGSFFFIDDKGLLEEEISVNDGPGYTRITHPKREAEFPYSGKAKTAYFLRLFSLMLSGMTVYLIYLIALTVFPGDTIFASASALFVATIPQFLYLSASISNENLSITLSTAYLLSLIYILKEPCKLRWQVIGGTLLGLCLLSKTFTLFYLPITVCFILWVYLRDRRNPILPLSIILSTAIVVAGWWYLRNWLLFNDPVFSKTVGILNPWHLQLFPPFLSYLTTVLQRTFTSFFGEFGTLQFSIPDVHFAIYGGIMLLGIAGLCRMLATKECTPFQVRVLGLFFLSLLGGAGIYGYLNIKHIGFYMGRYLFVVIAPFAIVTFLGVWSLFPFQWRKPLFIFLSLLLILLNLNVLFRVVKPAYAETLLVEGVNQSMFCCPTPEINSNTTVGQTFFPPRNNLCAIRVMFSCPVKQLEGSITFALKEAGDKGKTLHQMSYPLKKIDDTDRCYFIFPPIPNSLGREYQFTFNSPVLPPGKGISLWYNTSKSAVEGGMLINGKPVQGNLYFQAYCFTGEHPGTDWQGRRKTVINQEWYLSIRELQLYYERSKEFRVKTTTHEKLLQLEKVLKRHLIIEFSSENSSRP